MTGSGEYGERERGGERGTSANCAGQSAQPGRSGWKRESQGYWYAVILVKIL